MQKSATVVVNNTEGISIDFEPMAGEAVLNAVQVRRIDEAAKN